MATHKEAFEKSLEYFNGDTLAAGVFVEKYALTDNEGDIKELTPDDMHKRLSKEFARIEKKYPNPLSFEEIYDLLKNFGPIVPQGSPMNVIGNDYQIQSVGNCFVLEDVSDSYGGILYSDQQIVQLMKRRCGVGVDISNIRPRGLITKNAARTTDGIGVFMERFSNSCREVAQGGRRGALMISISITHPEVERFINIKKDKTKVTGANISIRLTKEFMQAVKTNSTYTQQWPIDSINPIIKKEVLAKDIWNQIINAAWESAEPGLMFWDHANNFSPSHIYKDLDKAFENKTSNPCGEIQMGTDSCRLLSMNLYSFVKNKFKENSKFDFKKFGKDVYIAQRLMDDIVDLEIEKINKILEKIEKDPEEEKIKKIEKEMWEEYLRVCKAGRRTGLGITALGDTLAALGIRYGSKQSIETTEEIYKTLAINAYRSSIHLAKERGSFNCWNYDLEKEHEFLNRIINSLDKEDIEIYKKFGRRNIALTTTAPTGSVSVLTQTSSGIEPVFLLSYKRRKKINPSDVSDKVDFVDALGDKWQEFEVYHHKFKEWMDISGKTKIEESPYYKSTSNDVDWLASVEIQSVAQKWICHSISKTCNVPNDATKELVSEIYMKAWESKCKGFTVYRDGCRDGVLISNESKKEEIQTKENHATKRPKKLPCDIHQVTVKGESWTMFVGKMNEEPYEIIGGLSKFIHIPKKVKNGILAKDGKKPNGSSMYDLLYGEIDEEIKINDIVNIFENPTEGSFTRTISLALRHRTPIHFIVEQLQKGDHDSDMYSYSKVIARVLKQYIKEGTKSSDKTCESCGTDNSIVYKEGCKTCISCGSSKCG